jgi:RNA polymerase sigma-70 factor (ECF subfamily)
MPKPRPTIEEQKNLLKMIADGNEKAFREFYDLFYRVAYREAFFYVKQKETCEDVVQETFLTFWKDRSKNIRIENPEAYLITVARNYAIKALNTLAPFTVEKVEELYQDRFLHHQTPENIVIDEETDRAISEAIDSLPPRCRTIFLLAREEGLKYREIAERLQISEKTVNAQMVIAIKKMYERLGKYFFFIFL